MASNSGKVFLKVEAIREDLLGLAAAISDQSDGLLQYKFVTEKSPAVTFIKFEPTDALRDGGALLQDIETLVARLGLEESVHIKFADDALLGLKLFNNQVSQVEVEPPLLRSVDDLLG